MSGLTKKQDPAHDGFYWEEYRNGLRVASGWHNGSNLSGEDNTENVRTDWTPPQPIRGHILRSATSRRKR